MANTSKAGAVSGAEKWEVNAITLESLHVDGSSTVTEIACRSVSFLAAVSLPETTASAGALIVEGCAPDAFDGIDKNAPARVRFAIKYFSEPRSFFVEGAVRQADGSVRLLLPDIHTPNAGTAAGDGDINRFLPPEET